ncbi:NUDIX domain-containing protein [Danxiaibacter flavus]|uniref:NUDIX domain-containing protein n=1 Tax=Danxiaibacter flavus TaxID=3049108 RepID=A0ABV3ZN49_9BACT|nr:NUDIX domain-containing protein [Chitinophagaceae bacterium DXS]
MERYLTSIQCAGLIVLKNRKLLLAFSKNKNAFYLPGGKVDADETSLQALQREIKEELNIDLEENDLQYYYHIQAPAFGENNLLMKQDCFICDLKHQPVPGNEIGGIEYFDEQTYRLQEHVVPGVITAFERLRLDDLVD